MIEPYYQHDVGLNTGNIIIGDFARKPFSCINQTESFLPFKIDKSLDYNYIKNHDFGVCFTNIDTWAKYIKKNIDISFGLRIHGTIMTLKSGKPAIIITHDGRTKEMAELFRIPHIDIEDFYHDDFCFEKIYENADFSKMHKEYYKLFKNYKKFLKKNNLPFKF